MFTQARAQLSVPVNSIWIAFKELPATLQRFCAPAFFHNEGEPTFDISRRGSALLVRFKDRNFAVLTRHQLGHGADAKEAREFTIGLDNSDGRKIGLTPVAVTQVQIEEIEHKNLEDFQICQYEDQRKSRDLRSLFLKMDLEHTLESVAPSDVKGIFLIGYPTEFSDIEVGDWDDEEVTMTLRLSWLKLYLKSAASVDKWDTENRIILEPDEREANTLTNPDGLSGAPVFFVWMDAEQQVRLGLVGLVTNARTNRFAVYSAVHMRTALQQCVDSDAKN